jgi:hypothetical protein
MIDAPAVTVSVEGLGPVGKSSTSGGPRHVAEAEPVTASAAARRTTTEAAFIGRCLALPFGDCPSPKRANDLSRGCTVTNIVSTVAITAIQAGSD